jgi:hypothetical protein
MSLPNEVNNANEGSRGYGVNEGNKEKTSIYLSLTQLAKVLRHDYNFPITDSTLLRYVNEGVIVPDHVLKRKFLFHKDRIPEIINTLENKFREKRLKQNNQNNTNIKKEDKNLEIDFKKMLLEVFKE